MNLVGFIISIYHDARSPERQIICLVSLVEKEAFVAPWSNA